MSLRTHSQFRFPDTGTVVSWPRRQGGTVVVSAAIPFIQARVQIALIMPRTALARAVRVALKQGKTEGGRPAGERRQALAGSRLLDAESRRLAITLADYAESPLGAAEDRPPQVSIRMPQRERRAVEKLVGQVNLLLTSSNLGVCLTLSQEALRGVRRVLASPEGYQSLRLALRMFLLPRELITWAVGHLPRGRSKGSWALKRSLPLAFGAARLLVERAEHVRAIGIRIKECIEEDTIADAYWRRFEDEERSLQKLAMSVALVDRAFRGAWQRYRLRAPCTVRDPRDVMRSHFYGRELDYVAAARREAQALDPHHQENLTRLAEDLLLGPPGEAGRLSRLLPS
jgi:hypothetical protein